MSAPTYPITFRDGCLDDYLRLAHHHYHPKPPATCARVIVAVDARTDETVGVLTVSLPVLNASWRDLIFPGRYRTTDRRADARRLNAEVRTISRLVVDPRFRSLGVATSLVRRYLRHPLTPVTEALAAMGAFSGFFAAAGMTAFQPPPLQRDLRLADALAALGVAPWMLADPARLPGSVLASPLLRRELRRWAQGSRATRRIVNAPTADLLRSAARIHHRPTAFVAVHQTPLTTPTRSCTS